MVRGSGEGLTWVSGCTLIEAVQERVQGIVDETEQLFTRGLTGVRTCMWSTAPPSGDYTGLRRGSMLTQMALLRGRFSADTGCVLMCLF